MAVRKLETEFDEVELFREYKRTGNIELRDELIRSYIYIAEILSRKFVNRGIEYDDIFQVACMGIMYAVERFDPDRGLKFATFATPTVMGEIRKYFRDKGSFIKIPRKMYEMFYKAERVRRSFQGSVTTGEISRILDIPEELIEKAYTMEDASFIHSLEYEAYADGSMNVSNLIGRDDSNYIIIEDKDFYEYCLKSLDEREREFIQLRYEQELTQKDISAKWGVSQMQVSRFEKMLLKKLRDLYFRD